MSIKKKNTIQRDTDKPIVLLLSSHQVMPDSFMTPWTVAHLSPLSLRFPRQEYWSGLPCPPPGDLPDPGIKPAASALAGGFFTTEPPGKRSRPNPSL